MDNHVSEMNGKRTLLGIGNAFLDFTVKVDSKYLKSRNFPTDGRIKFDKSNRHHLDIYNRVSKNLSTQQVVTGGCCGNTLKNLFEKNFNYD